MSIASALQNAQAKVAAAYTACDDKGATMPATQNLANLPDTIDSIPTGGETWRKWTRPSEWPQYTDAMIANGDVIYLTYDCRGAKAGAARDFAGFKLTGAYQVERGSVSNGTFTAVSTTTVASNAIFFEVLPTNEGDYVVYRITPTGTGHLQTFIFSTASQTGYTQQQAYEVQPCIERFARLPYFTGSTANSWGCAFLVSDTVKGLSSTVTQFRNSYGSCRSLEHCVLEGNLSSCTSLTGLFSSVYYLYDLDLSKFIIGSATKNLSSFLYYCQALERVNLGNGNWDTSGVTTMAQMFQYCYSLVEIKGVDSWDLSSLTSLDRTFHSCYALRSLACSNWETTSALTTMSQTFNDCRSLEEIDLSSLIVSGVTTFASMCYNCFSLHTINLSSWDMSGATTLATMFRYCYNLQNVIFGANGMKTSSALTTLQYTFDCCHNLRSIDLSNVVTSNVTDFRQIFGYCLHLREIDISSFNFTKQTTNDYVTSMFYNCTSLVSVTLPANGAMWQIGSSMFRYCRAISTIVFPSTVTSILTQACNDTVSAQVFDFRAATAIPSLANNNAFGGNTNSVIVVPDALYSQWIAATNWSSLASRIVSASNYTD